MVTNHVRALTTPKCIVPHVIPMSRNPSVTQSLSLKPILHWVLSSSSPSLFSPLSRMPLSLSSMSYWGRPMRPGACVQTSWQEWCQWRIPWWILSNCCHCGWRSRCSFQRWGWRFRWIRRCASTQCRWFWEQKQLAYLDSSLSWHLYSSYWAWYFLTSRKNLNLCSVQKAKKV